MTNSNWTDIGYGVVQREYAQDDGSIRVGEIANHDGQYIIREVRQDGSRFTISRWSTFNAAERSINFHFGA